MVAIDCCRFATMPTFEDINDLVTHTRIKIVMLSYVPYEKDSNHMLLRIIR